MKSFSVRGQVSKADVFNTLRFMAIAAAGQFIIAIAGVFLKETLPQFAAAIHNAYITATVPIVATFISGCIDLVRRLLTDYTSQ